MARTEAARYAFNRGLISDLALARVDLKRSALSAAQMVNWMARTLGSMMLRPGWAYLGSTASNAAPRYIAFVRSLSAMALLEFTTSVLRVWISDAVITRVAVSSAVSNGNFGTNLVGWTDNDEVGGVSAWVTGGYMGLTGNGTAAAIRDQQVTVAAGDQGVEHALRIVIQRGPVTLRVGSTSGGDEYVTETSLGTGTHSIAFTPTGNFYVRFMSRLERIVYVDSCNVEAAGVMSLPSPYLAADLDNIRADLDSLSVDVLFVGCSGYQQRRVERRGTRSWSVVLYQPEDGPFRVANVSSQTMTPSVLTGNGTLTSSVSFFRSTHVGALFRLVSTGQTVTKSMTALNDATSSIRVTGVGTDRSFTIVLASLTATGDTVVLQRSFDNSVWTDVSGKSWVADTTEAYTDGLDNQIVYYRLKCTVYAAGTVSAKLTIATGSITGVGRITGYTSATVIDIEVLTAFGAITATDDWAEGRWSDYRGWPSAGTLYEGRLCWGGYDQLVCSISDQYDGFEPDTEGDSGPIDRSIGSGPLQTINWLLPMQRLVLGAEMAEHSVRSNAFDEPLTPSNFNRKPCSTQGSANVQAVKVDSRGFFVQRGGTRLFELFFNGETYDYDSKDASILVPEIGEPRIVRIAVQRKPDTRVHCVRSDGTVAVLVYDHAEDVLCWEELETSGSVLDAVVLPGVSGAKEDQVYYAVQRTINGASVVYLEKWALESECVGGTLNKQADAFVIFTAAIATKVITGLSHLEGEDVVIWANGKDVGTDADFATIYTVAAGQITLGAAEDPITSAIIGLPYEAPWQSAKLGQTLSKHKSIDHFAPILKDTHAQGLRFGPDFDNLDSLPLTYNGTAVDVDTVYATYDTKSQEFPGTWDTDARLCLKAQAPRPCNILACVIEGQVT